MSEQENEFEHHKQMTLCTTRPAYRQGRKLTAIKVYTISSESKYLLIFGVPKINLRSELKHLCQKYGTVLSLVACPNYETEQFTECYRVKFERIQSARVAKKFLDTKNYYGGVLHVCYSPESETVEETRDKLKQRSFDVDRRLNNNNKSSNKRLKLSDDS